MNGEWVIAVASAGALVVAVCAMWVSHASLRQAERTTNADLLTSLLNEYQLDAMFRNLRTLGIFGRSEEGQLLIGQFKDLQESTKKPEEADVEAARSYLKTYGDSIEPARRSIDRYYNKVWRLYGKQYLSRDDIAIIADTQGSRLLMSVVRPLTYAISLAELEAGDKRGHRAAVRDLGWYDGFGQLIGKHKSIESMDWVTILLCVLGAGALVALLIPVPPTPENLAWHPFALAGAAVLLGLGLGRSRWGGGRP
jgi:hypothetical protein